MKNFSRQLLMPIVSLLLVASSSKASDVSPASPAKASIEGRWDINIDIDGTNAPSWLEVNHSGTHRLFGFYVGPSGSARPISQVNFTDGKISFSLPPQWENENHDITFEGTLDGDKLSGTMTTADGKSHNWTGVRAPSLRRDKAPVWGKPIKLLNGKDLTGWRAMGPNQWKVESGILRSAQSGSNLVTEQKFNDFKLHIEFRYPKGSNSGVYLRGRYEVQVSDSKGEEPLKDQLGAIYGFIAPSEMVAKNAGEWQTYDITLIGRMVTVVANGKMIICNQEIPGITGGALDSNEGEPGPLLIQGDHGAVDYRNIIITPAK